MLCFHREFFNALSDTKLNIYTCPTQRHYNIYATTSGRQKKGNLTCNIFGRENWNLGSSAMKLVRPYGFFFQYDQPVRTWDVRLLQAVHRNCPSSPCLLTTFTGRHITCVNISTNWRQSQFVFPQLKPICLKIVFSKFHIQAHIGETFILQKYQFRILQFYFKEVIYKLL